VVEPASVNLNISDLYQQYSKKQGSQTSHLNNTAQVQFYHSKPPQTSGHYRAISVLDQGAAMTNNLVNPSSLSGRLNSQNRNQSKRHQGQIYNSLSTLVDASLIAAINSKLAPEMPGSRGKALYARGGSINA
jgi:hypothetical protein